MSERQQLQKHLGHLDKAVTDKLHSRLATIQSNDTNLAKQTKALHARTQEARKHQDDWNNIVRAGRNGMKDLGDVSNWASLLDREITFLEQVLQRTEQ